MGSPININAGVFWGTFMGFLKSGFLQLFSNIAKVMSIWMSKVGQNSTAAQK